MKKFKKTTAFILAAAMAFSLVGCGGKKDDTKDSATGTDATGNDATEEVESTDTTEKEILNEADYDWSTTEVPVVEDDRFTTVEGADVLGLNFDDGDLGGFTTYVNGGEFEMVAENGELICDIKKTGGVEHGVQIYYDGFTMAKGCVYTVSFDIRSTVERTVEWRVQINGGDYHAYSSDKVRLTPETQTVTMEFTMDEESDPAPRFVINMGHYEGEPELPAHQVYVDNISLFVTDSSNAQKIEGAPTPIQVKVNQIGYAPDDIKTVIVSSKDDEVFKIVNTDTNETVYVGKYDPTLVYDSKGGSNIHKGDFTDFTTPGNYQIISAPSGASYEFSIGDNLYDDIYKDVVLMVYSMRCGSVIEEDICGVFAHDECHMAEAIIYGDDSGKTVDVSGGWHDAGDYGRYVVSGAKTVQDLFLAYEDFNYTSDEVGIPESGNGIPDLLDECKYELDWMLKMQDETSGGVYHKVTALVFPETVLATEETDQLVLAPISYAATADFAAVMAKASVLYADYDADYAKTCLDAAVSAYAFLEANPDMDGYKNPEEIVTGEYPDPQLDDELLWAAAELYIATGESKYLDTVNEKLSNTYRTGLGWASIGTYALYDLAKAEGIDGSVQELAKAEVLELADELLEACMDDGYFVGLKAYNWGSNMDVANNGMLFLMANKLSPNDDYMEYAQKQRDYIFGLNATGYCYVTGHGELSPQGTHHRPSQVLDVTLPGMLVGGPDQNLDDPYANAVLYGMNPALCYVDNEQSFSCNEITIYWNSPLIYLMTGLLYQ